MSLLQQFLINNAWSKVVNEKIDGSDETLDYLSKPWGDESLQLIFPTEKLELDTFMLELEDLILPRRFSALYHVASRRLEVIWTALKIPSSIEEISNRSFKFCFSGNEHECYFGPSSDRILLVAKNLQQVGPADTNLRNMHSFMRYSMETDAVKRARLFGLPLSFFICNVDSNEDKLATLAENLNFYMSYYDYNSPRILIHEDPDVAKSSARIRFRQKTFPSQIDASAIDENLLSFWMESFAGNEILQFMLHFRIMEYASTSYAADLLRRRVTRSISRPDLRSNPAVVVDEILEILNGSDTKTVDDHGRFMNTIKENVSATILWAEIEKDKELFSKKNSCDGGFSIEPLIDSTATFETFRVKGVEIFARQIREIRNVLSHGKDFPRDGVFRPTRRNLRLLRPWVTLMALASGEVVIGRVSR
jgi:hypothetical protein